MSLGDIVRRVAIVIPARNEAKLIGRVIQQARSVFSEVVVVVDDHSTDATRENAESQGARVVSLEGEQSGYGPAVREGFRVALEAGAAHIVTLDADGAHSPTDVPLLLYSHVAERASLTIGNRFATADFRIPSTKFWVNRVGTAIVNLAAGTSVRDAACGLRVYAATTALAMLASPHGKGFSLAYDAIFSVADAGGRLNCPSVTVRYDATRSMASKSTEILDLISAVGRALRDRGNPDISRVREMLEGVEAIVRREEAFATGVDDDVVCAVPTEGSGYYFHSHPSELVETLSMPLFRLPAVSRGG